MQVIRAHPNKIALLLGAAYQRYFFRIKGEMTKLSNIFSKYFCVLTHIFVNYYRFYMLLKIFNLSFDKPETAPYIATLLVNYGYNIKGDCQPPYK